jgi:hypothetical protein
MNPSMDAHAYDAMARASEASVLTEQELLARGALLMRKLFHCSGLHSGIK